ncbi:MAG: TetR/AcrR family transcriptional regulator [Nannocystales bacterium]
MMSDPTPRKKRGRPRAYDPEHALDAALEVFWTRGLDGTSLEDLREATGMNRPSLAAAFGDKRAIYLRTLARFRDRLCADGTSALEAAPSLEGKLESFYGSLIRHYGPDGGHLGRGCMLLGAATVLAPTDPDVATELTALLDQVHAVLLRIFKDAQASGELSQTADPRELAWLAAAVQHSLSTRARAGASKRQLSSFARASVRQVLRASTA